MRFRIAAFSATCVLLAACSDEGPIQSTSPKLTISPATLTVETGADTIALSAVPKNGEITGNVGWDVISGGDGGVLLSDTGSAVQFQPAPLGTGGDVTVVRAVALVNGKGSPATAAITVVPSTHGRLVLSIDPGRAAGQVAVDGGSLGAPFVVDAGVATVVRTPLVDAGTYLVTPVQGLVVPGAAVDGIWDATVSADAGTGPSLAVPVAPNRETRVDVRYGLRAGRGRLWVPVSQSLAGYSDDNLFVDLSTNVGFPTTAKARSVAFDADGNAWVAQDDGVAVYEAARLGQPTLAPKYVIAVTDPIGLAIRGDVVAVTSCSQHAVYTLSRAAGAAATPTPLPGTPVTACPRGIAYDKNGLLWVALRGTNQVASYPNGMYASAGAVSVTDPNGIAFDATQPSGKLWVSTCKGSGDPTVDAVVQPGGAISIKDASALVCPGGLAFDNAGSLWVAATGGSGGTGNFVRIASPGTGGGVGFGISPIPDLNFGGIAFSPAPAAYPVHQ